MKYFRERVLLIVPVFLCLATLIPVLNRVTAWLDQKYFDILFSFSHRAPVEHALSLLVKDQSFTDRFGREPDRHDMAQIITHLHAAGVRTAALDLIYDQAGTPEEDQALARAFDRFGGAILARRFASRTAQAGLDTIKLSDGGRPPSPLPLFGLLEEAAFGTGIINILADMDEVTRFMPLAFLPVGATEYVPSLGFATWLQYKCIEAEASLEKALSAKTSLPDPDAGPAEAEAWLRTLINQGPHAPPSLGHSGLDQLAKRFEAVFIGHLLGRIAGRNWKSIAERMSLDSGPTHSWISWPAQPLPWIGEPETPALRLPLRKVYGTTSGDGLPVLSMSQLLGMADAGKHPATALRFPVVEFHTYTQTQPIRLDYRTEPRGTAKITGMVSGFSGAPIAEARVLCMRLDGEYWAVATTNPDGSYVLADLPVGTYTLEITCGDTHTCLQAVLENGVHTATETRVEPLRLPPAAATALASFSPSNIRRDLMMSGEAVWIAWTDEAGRLPLSEPPAGYEVTTLETEEAFFWHGGRLLDASGTARSGVKTALTETVPVWKTMWTARRPIEPGIASVTLTGLYPSLGARYLLARPASEASTTAAPDCDLLIASVTTLATFPTESLAESGTATVSFRPAKQPNPSAIHLVSIDGINRYQFTADTPASIPVGSYRVLIENPDGSRGRYDPISSRLRQNPVFIGTHLPEDQDFRICPLNFWDTGFSTIYGVNLHGHLFSALQRQDFLKPLLLHEDRLPRAWPLATLLVLLPLILIADTVFLRHGAIRGGLVTLFFTGAWGAISLHLFSQNILLPIALPFICFLSFGTMRGYFAYMQARRREQQTRGSFSRFVSARMVDEILKNPHALKPGGEKCELTVMFTDLAGFTSISEMLSPEELTRLMNEYLGEMTNILFQYGGTLDKYIGDAVMAFWNYPMPQSDHALRAVRCAIAMQRRLNELRPIWKQRGLPNVDMRAGINTADCMVGFFGSDVQMNFTCLGDGVNLASRLEGANKAYHTLMMMAESTARQIEKSDVRFRFLDFLAVKGKLKPMRVFEIIGEKGTNDELWNKVLPLYDEGIALYLDRNWDKAEAAFGSVLELLPEDGPSLTYIERCQAFREAPPPPDWDGRFILKTK